MAPAGIGLAKVEAAAKTIRPVSDRQSKRIATMLLTESQEGGENASELHCSCGGGRFGCRRQSEWTGFEVDRMESGGEIGERCPPLNTSRR